MLAGEWVYVQGERTEIDQDGSKSMSELAIPEEHPHVVIHDDGSFDWSFTLGVFVPSISAIRCPGDRVEIVYRHDPEKRVRGYAELVRSRYEAKASQAVIKTYDLEGRSKEEYAYQIACAANGKAEYRREVITPDGARTIVTATLRRARCTEP